MSKWKKRLRRKFVPVGLVISLGLAALTGCGNVPEEAEDVIELHEPQMGEEAVMNTEPVTLRNLYKAYIYYAMVFPYVEEYSYESGKTFGAFDVVVGEEVQEGAPLLHMDTAAISKRIDSMEEKIRSLKENYQEYHTKAEETLSSLQNEVENLQEILENLEEEEPEATILGANGIESANPAYATWQKDYTRWQGQCSSKELSLATSEEALRQKTELYELDRKYYSGQLQKLREEQNEGTLTSQISGRVVAAGEYAPGDSIRAKTSVIAVGDMEKKYIKCNFIATVNRLRAEDIYAVVGGKRYELTYVETNDTNYSVFSLADENNETSVGDVAALVMMMNHREQVPTVSVDSIHKEGLQQYVYVAEDGNAVAKLVQTGMSDGVYTEILSGLEEGEEVLVSQALKAYSNTAVAEKGTMETSYGGSGDLVYPVRSAVNNPIEHGTVYFQEYLVNVNQHVEKGDVVALIRVEGDSVELARKETSLKRARERLADLLAEGEDEKNKDAIEQKRENIADLEEEIAQMRADYACTEIRATASGRILSRTDYGVGDAIKAGNRLVVIADEDTTYLSLDNSGNNLNYGDVLALTYTNTDGEQCSAEGKVVTLGNMMSGTFASKSVLVELPGGKLENVQTSRQTYSGGYVAVKINAAAVLEIMKDVIIVPKRAVTVIEGNTYVTVIKEDGTVMPVSVLVGCANRESYGVIDGLAEGMTICWE